MINFKQIVKQYPCHYAYEKWKKTLGSVTDSILSTAKYFE